MMKYVFDKQFGRLFEVAGLNVKEVLMGAHLPETLFSQHEIMLTKEEYFSLMESAGRLADEGASVRVMSVEGIETFSPPVFAAYCGKNALEFLSRFAHYKRLIGPLRYIMKRQGSSIDIRVKGVDNDMIPPFWVELETAFVLCLIRKATGRHIVPERMMLAEEDHSEEYRNYMGCPMVKGSQIVMTMRLNDMMVPFRSHNDAMWEYIEPELRRRLMAADVDMTTVGRVRSALVELLPTGRSSLAEVASKLCMSSRTLQRNLAKEKTTFQQQLNATRLLLAKNYLKSNEHTSDDIAFLLGYNGTTSFLRAFALWTGMSLSEYRRNNK